MAGGRPEGKALLMDDQSLETFYNRGLGSITGSSLGVDSIGEFQTLTNTYGAQYGGSGAVMNAVTRSGTNTFHGSLYEFLRNSAMDARNFTDPSHGARVPQKPIRRHPGRSHQEGQSLLLCELRRRPVRSRIFSNSHGSGCEPSHLHVNEHPHTGRGSQRRGSSLSLPSFNLNSAAAGTGQTTVVANQPAHENYFLGAVDYNISDKDSVFARYFIDLQDELYPFSRQQLWPWSRRTKTAPTSFSTWRNGIFSLPR